MYQKTKSSSNERQYKKSSTKHRKVRSDKKKDIKVPLNEGQKRMIRWGAYKREMTATSFSTILVEEALTKPYIKDIPGLPYEDTHDYVHIKLKEIEYEQVVKLSIVWNVSVRKGVHRILLFMLGDGVEKYE